MSDPDTGFDILLAARFEREHTHVPADPFVGAALKMIRRMQRRAAAAQIGLRLTALLAVLVASPWLIAGAARFNALLQSSLAWTAELPGAWALAALAAMVAMLVTRALHNR